MELKNTLSEIEKKLKCLDFGSYALLVGYGDREWQYMSDDVNLDVGRMRVRKNGSDGGQKGLRSIIETMGTSEFPRIRIGVGKKPHPDYNLADWVLGNFSPADKTLIGELYPTIFEGVEKILSGDVDGAIQLCNSKVAK